jgi:hypothetical protein
MKTTSASRNGANLVVIVLGFSAALLIFAVLTGRKIPLLSSERAALLALIAIGMVICSQGGIGPVADSGAWLHPFSILGYLLGAAILVIGLAALFGINIPPMTSYYQSFAVAAILAALKVVLSTIHHLFL